tara:strand:+ start:1566 stop:2141 length:576 start_codon:yes stop_codon:yes gene_type:complete
MTSLIKTPDDILEKISEKLVVYEDFQSFRNCHPILRKCINKYDRKSIRTKIDGIPKYRLLNKFDNINVSYSTKVIDCGQINRSIKKLNCMCCNRVMNLGKLDIQHLEVCDATMFMANDITTSHEMLVEAILKMKNLKSVIVHIHHFETKFGRGPLSKWNIRNTLNLLTKSRIDYEVLVHDKMVLDHHLYGK